MDIKIITGRAGTGKSTYLAKMISNAHLNNQTYNVLAFTHSAVDTICDRVKCINVNIGITPFKTLHSFFKISPIDNIMLYDSKIVYDFIFIDEFSLIPKELFINILYKLHCRNLILCGEIFQLPPISVENDISYDVLKYYMVHIFKSNIDANMLRAMHHFNRTILYILFIDNSMLKKYISNISITTLKKNLRSNDNVQRFINYTFDNHITVDPIFIDYDNISKYILDKNYTYLASTYEHLQMIYNIVDATKTHTYHIIQKPPLSFCLKHLYLTEGDKIQSTDNFTDHDYIIHNGDIFTFSSYDAKTNSITCFDKNYICVTIRQMLTCPDIETSAKYFPIMPAFLSTIHKAQGKGYDNVILCIDNLFEFPMLYTGVSRARNNILFYTKFDKKLPDISIYNEHLQTIMNSCVQFDGNK